MGTVIGVPPMRGVKTAALNRGTRLKPAGCRPCGEPLPSLSFRAAVMVIRHGYEREFSCSREPRFHTHTQFFSFEAPVVEDTGSNERENSRCLPCGSKWQRGSAGRNGDMVGVSKRP